MMLALSTTSMVKVTKKVQQSDYSDPGGSGCAGPPSSKIRDVHPPRFPQGGVKASEMTA